MIYSGVVIDGEGKRIADALVGVMWGTAPTPEISIRTDPLGNFRIDLPPGRFRLAGHAPDGRIGTIDVEVPGRMTGDIIIVVHWSCPR